MSELAMALIAALVADMPQIEAAIQAIIKMTKGEALTDAEKMALGDAMETAHRRAQGTV